MHAPPQNIHNLQWHLMANISEEKENEAIAKIRKIRKMIRKSTDLIEMKVNNKKKTAHPHKKGRRRILTIFSFLDALSI